MIYYIFCICSSPIQYPLFFFLMIRRPPRSTLFPYRRSSDLSTAMSMLDERRTPNTSHATNRSSSGRNRSEEHTSELQSRQYLVCRLLLEKKKKIFHSSKYQTAIPVLSLDYYTLH